MSGGNGWREALRLHEDAVAGFVRTAESLPSGAWSAPMAEAKWSPAQVVDHLVRAYDVLLRELGGGPGMALRTRAWQRLLLRFTVVPRLLRGDPFPRGARAPRETRPPDAVDEDGDVLLARFRSRAAEFQAAVEAAHQRTPRKRLTHAYFGASSLEEGVVLCARHILHHQRQLSAVDTAGRTPS